MQEVYTKRQTLWKGNYNLDSEIEMYIYILHVEYFSLVRYIGDDRKYNMDMRFTHLDISW